MLLTLSNINIDFLGVHRKTELCLKTELHRIKPNYIELYRITSNQTELHPKDDVHLFDILNVPILANSYFS